MDTLELKHAFVTGGASGIGLGIAEALAAKGLAVTVADIDDEALEAVAASHAGQFKGLKLDVTDRESWSRAKAQAEAALGPVDILVNNAGITADGREIADAEPASFDRAVAINLTGVFNGMSAFAADMRARGRGHIVNTSSMMGLASPYQGMSGYAAAKAGVVALTEVARQELASHGVGVSVLCPWYVATNLTKNTAKLGQVRTLSSAAPESRLSCREIGDLVVEAIAANELYVISHPEVWPMVEARLEALRRAFEPPD